MKKIIKWLMEPYGICISELKYLTKLRTQTHSKKEKIRIYELLYFNVLLMMLYSLFLLSSFIYIILSIIIEWYG
ncbi:hypothetical protein J9303_18820, partial [Bacillaceae bacterium Marseille-Q3522]|nr:hypothetical protein [Bacillaceae bacterium Marseille-Q3522]